MMTCLRCSFQASPLLVFWESWCLPTMAWLIQLPRFLAQHRGCIARFCGEHTGAGVAGTPRLRLPPGGP